MSGRRSLPATMRSLASMMKLGKQRPPPEEDERKSLKDSDQLEYGGGEDSYTANISRPALSSCIAWHKLTYY
ncbi:hypothetical protein NPIL_615671 [Nephila pilipes]|uniref:Uncharacterized protein n=1 Tax=Nephila pilipes TaxID=299642 RepID=A0A8X6QBH0_NEPPI|nr:hypothetical protein NPIL_615671 [Nephila pilipes]